MSIYTTEIASDKIASDNPIHQRLLRPYELISQETFSDVLEIGCGEGRGAEILLDKSRSYKAIDKIQEVVDTLSEKYPAGKFVQMSIPPMHGIPDNAYDLVISFQVIEHIKNDHMFLQEVYRVLKPGGKAVITTPNINKTLTRNPWHIREYTAQELTSLAEKYFSDVKMKGIGGNEKVMKYYEENRQSVRKITRFDVLNLQYRLPGFMLRLPYDILNRMNRNKLQKGDNDLVNSIRSTDYILTENPDEALDLYLELYK